MTRYVMLIAALAFAGGLFVGCEGEKTPAPPAGKPAVTTPAAPAGGGAAVTPPAVPKLACANAGCKNEGKKEITMNAKDGKPVFFCCNDCMEAYKKANP